MNKILIAILAFCLLPVVSFAATVPASPWAHPRCLVNADVLDSLQARADRGTPEWVTLDAWCVSPQGTPAEWADGNRITNVTRALNFAVGYLAAPDSVQWAHSAYLTIAAFLDYAYDGYDTITAVTEYDYGYNMRWMPMATALVYDWCYDALTAGEKSRLSTILNMWLKEWYINLRDENDAGTACHRPGNNYYLGYLQSLLIGGYALYYDVATYPPHYVSYARDTLMANEITFLKNGDMMWEEWGDTMGFGAGGMYSETWPGYGDNAVEFLGTIFQAVAKTEADDIEDIFGFNLPEQCVLNFMYNTLPNTNYAGAWSLYGYGADIATGSFTYTTWYAVNAMLAAIPEANDTAQVARWWLDAFLPRISQTTRNYWQRFLFYNPGIVTIAADTTGGHNIIGDAVHAPGINTVVYRDAWADTSCNNISIWLRGGIGRENHMGNYFSSFRINAADNLVGNYKYFAGAEDMSDWSNSGLFCQGDGSSGGDCDRRYDDNYYWGRATPAHMQNTDTLVYYSIDVSNLYDNAGMTDNDRGNHVTHKEVEWIYLKEDSVLMMMDRAVTREATYRHLLPATGGCDTLWAALEANKQWQIWSETEPTAYGTSWRIAGKTNVMDLIVNTAYPTSGVSETAISRKKYKTASSPTAKWRLLDSLSTPSTEYVTLHTMKIVPDAGPFTTLTPTCSRGLCAVAAFRSNAVDTLDYLVAFSADTIMAAGGGFNGDSLIIGHTGTARNNTRVIVADLTPNTAYYWNAVFGSLDVTVSKNDPGTYTSATSDTAGVLIFDTGEIECPTVVKSSIATQSITSATAILHLHMDYSAVAGFRYHATGDNPWVYRRADDSTQATISIASLNPNADYTWESNTKYSTCDSTAYGDSTSFTTSCPTVTKSNIATQTIAETSAILHFHTNYVAHGGFRYHKSGAAWTYRHDADADSLQHTIAIAGLDGASNYTWQSNARYEDCDSLAYGDSTSFATLTVCYITVTAPVSAAEFTIGHSELITWTSENAGTTVKIELYKGEALASTINSSTANDGSYAWNIIGGLTADDDYTIKITDTADGDCLDSSDAFEIVAPATNNRTKHFHFHRKH